MLCYDVVKDNAFIEMVNSEFHFSYHPLKSPLHIQFAYRFEVGTFLCKMTSVSVLHAQQFPATSINPEKAKNGRFWTEGIIASHIARASLWTKIYTLYRSILYPMVFTACRYDFPLPSNRLGIRAVLSDFFLRFSNFLFLMLNQWMGATGTFARASGTPSVSEGPKFDTMIGPL